VTLTACVSAAGDATPTPSVKTKHRGNRNGYGQRAEQRRAKEHKGRNDTEQIVANKDTRERQFGNQPAGQGAAKPHASNQNWEIERHFMSRPM
jgi:hypothetical protein